MDIALLVGVYLALVVAVVAAIGAWRRSSDAAKIDALQQRFDALETLVRAEVAGARESLERRIGELGDRQAAAQIEFLDRITKATAEASAQSRRELGESLGSFRAEYQRTADAQRRTLDEMRAQTLEQLGKASESQREFAEKSRKTVEEQLQALRGENEARLEKIRVTVDEKLQSTLEKRLGESFKQVSDRLEMVHKGLGEMQQLAQGVGDLKKVLTNVRTRGTFGEVQLKALLEQVMNPSQYDENVATVPGSSERVEFAIILPGKGDGDESVYLPIDAKFPQEDYQRLQQAYEDGDQDALAATRKALRDGILREAKRISEKYVAPPHTTDFGLLFLPTEGLFAEVLRTPGLAEEVQQKYRVIVTGPTTLYAVLNSLQMGFRTLAIEKRSSEVWKVLGAIKTEFGKFDELLGKVSRNLGIAQRGISKLRTTRTNVMQSRLEGVQELPVDEASDLLGLPADPMDDEDEQG